ncbi:hypothetical protein Moror_4818 [Moniliophthora roreri MCA 2997]|uniref:Uncharacterized protein n=1 Tax=Moniliophthora roreri (strain MCA 2997) TaxID=1381753 RepID=V2XEP1_MONRO|nr:hypothetical protein Moror_4818 [Moniliophthora roreri MCA 2997]
MHACLACFSDEVKALDSIICQPPIRPLSSKPATNVTLPTEIILHVRSYLLANITEYLIIQSLSALQRYENTLCQLLCTECLSYNQYVYGNDVWQWTEFTGACHCVEARQYLLASPADYSLSAFSNALAVPSLNPKRFVDRQEWLEYYLSRKSLQFTAKSISPHSQKVIWDLVAAVLKGFHCRSVRERLYAPSYPRQRGAKEDVVLIVPVPDSHGSQYESSSDSWMMQVLLKRVERDLALKLDYQPIEPSLIPSVPTTSSYSDRCSSERLFCYTKFRCSSKAARLSFVDLLQTIHVCFTAVLCLPLSFTTLLLTLICFYCKPRAFRARISV